MVAISSSSKQRNDSTCCTIMHIGKVQISDKFCMLTKYNIKSQHVPVICFHNDFIAACIILNSSQNKQI